jgi:hypothetical protein
MVAWKDQLSDLQLASVITYVRNSFGNELGDVVEPKDITAARGTHRDILNAIDIHDWAKMRVSCKQ